MFLPFLDLPCIAANLRRLRPRANCANSLNHIYKKVKFLGLLHNLFCPLPLNPYFYRRSKLFSKPPGLAQVSSRTSPVFNVGRREKLQQDQEKKEADIYNACLSTRPASTAPFRTRRSFLRQGGAGIVLEAKAPRKNT
jgi:hypothetical protein